MGGRGRQKRHIQKRYEETPEPGALEFLIGQIRADPSSGSCRQYLQRALYCAIMDVYTISRARDGDAAKSAWEEPGRGRPGREA